MSGDGGGGGGADPGHPSSGLPRYRLRLFVAGNNPRSLRTIANLHHLCAEHLEGRLELEVVDIYQQPHLAEGDQVVAAPTLVKLQPPPLRRIVGDLSDTTRVLRALDLSPSCPDTDEP